jgi:solute carrier family 25 carnitine/acylcarnitine transporter 20/29
MRLWACIPLTLLALISSTSTSQIPWHSQPGTQSVTLLDLLNADEDYTLLLSLLQRARLIPTLNKLNGSTLFAPTNDAVKRHSSKNSLWQNLLMDTDSLVPDNVQGQLRQQLFYHLLNYSVNELPEDSATQTLKTLHFPKVEVNPPTHEPPPSSPWFPIPDGLLGDEPQRLRLTSRDGSAWVGTDTFGNGGVEVVKKKVEATNGVVYGISAVLEPPSDLGTPSASLYLLDYNLPFPQSALSPTRSHYLISRRC